MRGSNNQPDDNNLKTDVALLKKEVEHINRREESRERWVQGIGTALIVGALGWFGLIVVGAPQKTNPVVPTIIQK